MKNWKRNLIVGFIWGLIFFLWWMAGFYSRNWNFNLFSADSWRYLYQEFIGGWVISETSDWIFVLVLFLSIPFFVIGWNIMLKIKWRKTVFQGLKKIWYALRRLGHKLFGKEVVVGKKKIKYIQKKSHKKQRPAPLHMSARAMERNAQKRMENASAIAGGASMGIASSVGGADGFGGSLNVAGDTPKSSQGSYPSFLDETDFDNISLDDIQLPSREALNEDIPDILIKGGYQVIANPEIGHMPVDFVAIDAQKIYVMVSDNEAGDWLADEERFNGEDPLWFSESSHRVSPIFMLNSALKQYAERLQKVGVVHEVIPVLIVKEGTIINAEDMQKTWDDMKIIVCRTHMGGPDELPTVAQAMPAVTAPADVADIEKIRNAF